MISCIQLKYDQISLGVNHLTLWFSSNYVTSSHMNKNQHILNSHQNLQKCIFSLWRDLLCDQFTEEGHYLTMEVLSIHFCLNYTQKDLNSTHLIFSSIRQIYTKSSSMKLLLNRFSLSVLPLFRASGPIYSNICHNSTSHSYVSHHQYLQTSKSFPNGK